ncbi:MAG: metallophosphoesterase [Gemmatimonadota bacterium]|nr:metallophosphoesterase [Gemmatimonadota bacterium]MDH4349155.1 metallophosphoesterase [Gemmatimonadota bacterium]
MRLAHLADLHLGFRQFHRQTAGGLNQREADVAHAFRRAIAQVIAERPDVVVVAGDLFHSVRPTNHSILLAFNEFHRLREALPDAPLILVAGNHDTPRSTETGSIFGLFASLGADVVADEPRRLVYPSLGLSVLAVPDAGLRGAEPPSLTREGDEPCQVLVLHGEVEGLFPADRSAVEYGGAVFPPAMLARGGWDYVALGHYHVQREVAPRAWYCGSLDYVSTNPWGELAEERKAGSTKGWLLVNLPAGAVERRPVPPARRFIDLPVIDGADHSAPELDAAIAAALSALPGGHADQVIRQVVRNVPRHLAREMDHAALRRYKAEALHYLLDLRRPESQRETGIGSPGHRQTLPELVEDYLGRRLLPGEIDREAFVRAGVDLIEVVERERLEG